MTTNAVPKTHFTPSQQARYEARLVRVAQQQHDRLIESQIFTGEIEDDLHYEDDEYTLASDDYTKQLELSGVLPTPIEYSPSSSRPINLPASDIAALRAALASVAAKLNRDSDS